MTDTTWAGRSASAPTPEEEKERAGWIPIAGVVAALGLVGAGGYLLGISDDPGETANAIAPTTTVEEAAIEPTEQVEAEVQAEVQEEVPAEEPDPIEADEETAAPTVEAEPEVAEAEPAEDVANQVVLEDGEVRGALLRDGILYLGGAVPSQDVADQIIERAEAVVGAGNVVSEYVIDPTSEMGQGAPLYIDDVVLFAYGANTYDPQFEPLLDLGLRLLSQNPTVTVTIITHTDASGSVAFNDRLSYQRGQSVAQYWVDRGIPVEQIVIDSRGERDPRADNHDETGAQLNRRAEFYIEGLLP